MNERLQSIKDVMDTIVPITRFNQGDASKIFDEVEQNGFKVVLKNDVPACVLIPPEKYESMVEALEDYALYFEAEKRMKNAEKQGTLSSKQVYEELLISQDDLDSLEVELE